jgi:DNA-binding beta-propeller fold protein YncE
VSIELVSPPTSIPLWDATKRFTLEGHYLNGAREPLLSSLTWNSSNTSVATLVAVGEGEDPSFSGTMNVYAMFHPRALGSTNITATYGSLTSSPVTVTVKPSYAYIANRGGNSVTICRVNTDHDYTDEESYTEGDEDGDLIECAAHTDRSFSEPIDLTLNADRTKIYVVNYSNNTVSLCSLTNGGAGMGSCSVQSLLDNGVNPSGIILSNRIPTIAYVSYKEPTGFATCDVASTGGLSGCVSHTSSGSARIYNPNIADVTLAENLGSYYIYFASYGDSLHHGIIGCRFHEGSQTKIERCFGVGRGDHLEASKIYFNEPQSIDFNEDYTEYYVQNSGNDTVGYCVNDVCRYYPSSGQAFSFTAGEKSGLFRSSDSYLYVTNSANNTVSKCLMTNGVIVSCTATSNSSTFNVPSDIVIGVGT